jgi:hypothetical protein
MLIDSMDRNFLRSAVRTAILVIFLGSPAAFARDLQGRIGLGYNAQFANKLPGVSLKYGLTRDIAAELILAIATTSPSNSATAIKMFKNLFLENNLNFYFMLGGGIINVSSQAGVSLMAGFGVEFFIPGIDSLGFAVETGAAFDNASGGYALKTLGMSFLDAGIHFYF